jgi:hypothetical protein
LQQQEARPLTTLAPQVLPRSGDFQAFMDDVNIPDATASYDDNVTYEYTPNADLEPLALVPEVAGLAERLCLLHYAFLSKFNILR